MASPRCPCARPGGWFGFVLLALLLAARLPAETDDFATVLERLRTTLLAAEPPAALSQTAETGVVFGWVATLEPDGRWADIDYANQQEAAWQTVEHLRRVRTLARAWVDPRSTVADDAKTGAALRQALNHWTAVRYTNPNWWHNEIGVPQLMRDILLLLGDRLTAGEQEAGMEVVQQMKTGRARQGTNTLWAGELALTVALLRRDEAEVDRAVAMLESELALGGRAGLQRDFSFHQHGPRLQQFHYGAPFLQEMARLAWQLQGTRWVFEPEQVELLLAAVMEGYQWMVRGTVTVPGTLDRAVARPGAMAGGDLREPVRYLRALTPARREEVDALLARQDGLGLPLVGFRSFPASDFAAYHRGDYSAFLKTVSTRTKTTESINGENLRGERLACGDHYLLRDGHEYLDLPPVWNWRLVPGVTHARGAGRVRRQALVGAVGDDRSGATTMDYAFGSKEVSKLTAKKLWVFHRDMLLCLMGGLSVHELTTPVRTALDQCRWRGPVTVQGEDGQMEALEPGVHPPRPLRWVHHHGFAYVPLGGLPVGVRLGEETGAWADISRAGSEEPVTEPVFLPVLEHGVEPVGQNAGFAILSCATPEVAAARLADPPWSVLRNDVGGQAVQFNDGSLFAMFYAPGGIEDENGRLLLAVDQPCLLMITQGQLRVVDPTHNGLTLTVSTDRQLTIECPPGGISSEPVQL